MNDSKKLWLSIVEESKPEPLTIGRLAAHSIITDPMRFSFVTARYKFCARMLSGMKTVLEVGCGDGFGSIIVADQVDRLICTDINEDMLKEAQEQLSFVKNITFKYHDFRKKPYEKIVDAIYLIDTIEHIYPEEEDIFMSNLCKSLSKFGVCIIGTPNKIAEKYSSEGSKKGHVNLMNFEELKIFADKYFCNAFHFGMNDEIVHTGFPDMTHYRWALCTTPRVSV